jgi:hypothetical protein
MKRKICAWLRSSVASSGEDDHVVLVVISHGTKDGSVLIGGETKGVQAQYLTNFEIKQAAANLHRNSSLTLVNTCCYSGGWINLTRESQGRRYVAAATSANTIADNFLSRSGRYRGGVFVTAFLECLKRSPEGLLSQFSSEVKAEVLAYRNPRDQKSALAPPISAFIPIQKESTLQDTVAATIADVKTTNLHDLFKAIKPARKREAIPDELAPEFEHYRNLAMQRGGSNGEDQIHEACRTLLEDEDDKTTMTSLFRTVSFREKARLDAERLARDLNDKGIIDIDLSDLSDEALSPQGCESISTSVFGITPC